MAKIGKFLLSFCLPDFNLTKIVAPCKPMALILPKDPAGSRWAGAAAAHPVHAPGEGGSRRSGPPAEAGGRENPPGAKAAPGAGLAGVRRDEGWENFSRPEDQGAVERTIGYGDLL